MKKKKASDTFVKTIEKIGIEKVKSLKLKSYGWDLISTERHPKNYAQSRSGNYLIMVHSKTKEKKMYLEKIAKLLGIVIKVEIIEQ